MTSHRQVAWALLVVGLLLAILGAVIALQWLFYVGCGVAVSGAVLALAR